MPLWVRLDYLISTWAQTPEEEQLLMGARHQGAWSSTRPSSGADLKGESIKPRRVPAPLAVAEARRGGAVAFLGERQPAHEAGDPVLDDRSYLPVGEVPKSAASRRRTSAFSTSTS